MNVKTCASLKEEQLYILEIFVDRVSLYPEKFERIDSGGLGVDLKFPDFPLFRIFQAEFELTKQEKRKETSRDGKYRVVHFHAGKMYLFTKNPTELVQSMRSSPLMLEVYNVKDISKCPYEIIKDPLGEMKIPFPGCLCDQVMMAGNDAYHLPKSYEIKNSFVLVDEQYKPSGLIALFIRLTCFGKLIMSEYSIVAKKLLFKNDGSYNEFLCTKVPLSDEEERRAAEAEAKKCLPEEHFEESELDAPPRPCNVAGLCMVCREAAKIDGYPLEVLPKRIEYISHEIESSLKQPEQDKRQNDYNSIVQTHILLEGQRCTSTGCAGSLCIGMKKKI